ncbi:MAG: PEP-CTERM sorting domain-containing protein [Planctomycetota bacterium]
MRSIVVMLLVGGGVGLSNSGVAVAATPFAGEDFDGGSTNGGLAGPFSSAFSPDLSSQTPPGSFDTPSSGGIRFDYFGVTSRDDEFGTPQLPFDVVDDSLFGFFGDQFGLIESTKLDNFVLVADPRNAENTSGQVAASWSFAINGRGPMEFSIDLAAIGQFDTIDRGGFPDIYGFTYSIDGGPERPLITLGVDQDFVPGQGFVDSDIPYLLQMESGAISDRYDDPFFDDSDWFDLVDFGPSGSVDYHSRDNGTDGDFAAEDGFVPVTFATGVSEVRALSSNAFGGFSDELDVEPFINPLFANPTLGSDATGNNFDSGVQLNDEFQTISAPIVGTGAFLTINFSADANGSNEYVAFDNLQIAELSASGQEGDFNGDGLVEAIDLNLLLDNWGLPFFAVDPLWINGLTGVVDNDELGQLLSNWGAGITAVPEPSTATLVLVGLAAASARRRA